MTLGSKERVLSEQEDRGKSPRPWWRKKEKWLLGMNEFQLTLINILQRRGMSVADLAEQTGYNPVFFENILTGKSRQMPVDFFLRTARVLDLGEEEKEALVRSWAFGVERESY